jgi:hypothetical protein
MEENSLKKVIEFKGLVINRIPEKYKIMFKELAKEEFADDYGNLLRQLLVSFFEYEQLKTMFLTNNLDIQLVINGKQSQKQEMVENIKTNIMGKPIGKGGTE